MGQTRPGPCLPTGLTYFLALCQARSPDCIMTTSTPGDSMVRASAAVDRQNRAQRDLDVGCINMIIYRCCQGEFSPERRTRLWT